jgi:ABC-type Fe3+/spermidine/putrescine transport system ATPase subunit
VPDLVLRDVVKSYGEKPILDCLDLEVHDKEFVTLLGPSGCGKTTTLMAIAGFQHPDSGHISCGDDVFFDSATNRRVAAERRNLGIVFQSYAIWPHMTVVANVAFPPPVAQSEKGRSHPAGTRGPGAGRAGSVGGPVPAPALRRAATTRRPGSCPVVLTLGAAAR